METVLATHTIREALLDRSPQSAYLWAERSDVIVFQVLFMFCCLHLTYWVFPLKTCRCTPGTKASLEYDLFGKNIIFLWRYWSQETKEKYRDKVVCETEIEDEKCLRNHGVGPERDLGFVLSLLLSTLWGLGHYYLTSESPSSTLKWGW